MPDGYKCIINESFLSRILLCVYVSWRGMQISGKRIKVLEEKQIQGFVSENMNDGTKN